MSSVNGVGPMRCRHGTLLDVQRCLECALDRALATSKADQMTEDRARALLQGVMGVRINSPNSVSITSSLSPDELEALAYWMRNHGTRYWRATGAQKDVSY